MLTASDDLPFCFTITLFAYYSGLYSYIMDNVATEVWCRLSEGFSRHPSDTDFNEGERYEDKSGINKNAIYLFLTTMLPLQSVK